MGPKRAPKPPFDIKVFLAKANGGKTIVEYRTSESIFVQGDTANAIFYIKKGKVKLTVLSDEGKEAVVAILKEADFFGEGCLAGQQVRMATAVAISECSLMKLEKATVIRLLHEEPSFSETILSPSSFSAHQNRGRLGRSTVQSQREAVGTGPSLVGDLREGGHTPNRCFED